MKRARWMYSCLAILVVAASAHGTTFFVDAQGGADTNTGLSAAEPFSTIQKAVDQAAANSGPDLIQIVAGQYYENVAITDPDTLTLSGVDGATVIAPDNTKNVITIYSGEVTISDLTVTKGRTGIKAEGAGEDPATWTISLTLRDIVSHDNKKNGVSADYANTLMIVHSRFYANGEDGIKAGGANAVSVSGTTSEENGRGVKPQDGLDIENVEILCLDDVTVRGNGDDGAEIDYCGSVTIIQGSYCKNGVDGIDIDYTKSISIVGVAAMDNISGNGLLVESADSDDNSPGVTIESVTVCNGEFLRNAADGIHIAENRNGVIQKVSLVAVSAQYNAQSGVEINTSGNVKVSALKSQNNGLPDVLP